MSRKLHTYADLEQQIHKDLRIQHPEWVEPTGECPECAEHEARLKELLEALVRTRSSTEVGHQVLPEDRTTPSS